MHLNEVCYVPSLDVCLLFTTHIFRRSLCRLLEQWGHCYVPTLRTFIIIIGFLVGMKQPVVAPPSALLYCGFRFSNHSTGPFCSRMRDMELAAGVLSYFLCCARTIAALCVFVCFGHFHFGFGLSGAISTEGLASDECQLT